ncbi:MAG: hypothetical protein QM715_21270 [Nibricoccus sp.]
MKLFLSIHLSASKREFCFSDGAKTYRFQPVVYLSREMKVLAVGDAPMQGDVNEVARIFEDVSRGENSFDILEAMMRFGVREMTGSLCLGPIKMRISIDPDLRAFLRGFAPALFYFAAQHAGATKIVIE